MGNSLLEAAVDMRRLQELVRERYCVRRIAIGDTRYFDWFFGIRRLFAEGARPDVVAIMVDDSHLVESRMRWDYTAHYMMDFSDIPAAAKLTGADRNRTLSMMLANRSAFWGTRVEIRNWLFDLATGGVAEGLRVLALRPAEPMSREAFEGILGPRLARLVRFVSSHGARLWIIVPPRLRGSGQVEAINHAGTRFGITVLAPLSREQWSAEQFSDGYHLNAQGAQVFTTALARSMASTASPFVR